MGAPPHWGPNSKRLQESYAYDTKRETEEKCCKARAKEKRDLNILRNGDLAMNRDSGKIGIIVEAGYRSWVEVHTNGKTHKWLRDCVDVIPKNGDLVKHRDTDETGVVVEAERRSFIDVLIDKEIRRWDRENVEVIDESR